MDFQEKVKMLRAHHEELLARKTNPLSGATGYMTSISTLLSLLNTYRWSGNTTSTSRTIPT